MLKGVIKKNNDEMAKHTFKIKEAAKLVKSKDKEIYNLETKNENMLQTINNLKGHNNVLKNENKNLEKAKKQASRKAKDVNLPTSTVSTSTIDLKGYPCELCFNKFSHNDQVNNHMVSDEDTSGFDGENNDIPTDDIETKTEVTDTVEESGTENTLSYEVVKAMLLDHFQNLNKTLSDGISKLD